MKFNLITLITLATAINSATAIQCYVCLFNVGSPGSNQFCKNDYPGAEFLGTCNTNNVTRLNANSSDLTNPDSKAKEDMVCFKMGGKVKGHVFIQRGCGEALVDYDLHGHCEVSQVDEYLSAYGTIAKGAKTFACSGDRCNAGPVNGVCNAVTPPTTTAGPDDVDPTTNAPITKVQNAGASTQALVSFITVFIFVTQFVL